MKVHTKETQANMTPALSLEALKQGNYRFQENHRGKQRFETAGQGH